MIDNFSVLLTHGLMLLTAWLFLRDSERDEARTRRSWTRKDPGA